MKRLMRRLLQDLGKLTTGGTYPSVPLSRLDKAAYDKGRQDYDNGINANPYQHESIEHYSWGIGHQDADHYDRSLW